MKTYTKTLLTTLPVVIISLALTVATTYYFSKKAMTDLAELWLASRLSEAMDIVKEQEGILHEYGLEQVPASIAKAKLDSGTIMASVEVGRLGYLFAVDRNGIITAHPDERYVGRDMSRESWFQSLTNSQGRVKHVDHNGTNLAMYDYFSPWQWYIFAVDPEREIYGAAKQMKPYLISLGIIASVVLAIALMLLTRRWTGPLGALTKNAEKIGAGDLRSRIDVTTRDEFGRLASVFNSMADNLQQTLTALQYKEEHFRSLIENSSDIIAILDKRGIILYISPSVERTLGYSVEEMIGKEAFEVIRPDNTRRLQHLLDQNTEINSTWGQVELNCRHKNGSWRTLETTTKNLIDHPAVAGLVFNARDITKRKEAEAALQRSHQELENRVVERTAELAAINTKLLKEIDERKRAETALKTNEAKLEAILMASPVGIALVVNGRLDWANKTLYQMLGYEEESLTGQHVAKFYQNQQDYHRINERIHQNIRDGRIGQAQTRWERKDKSAFDCALRALALDTSDPAKGLIFAVSDISEGKRLEAELQRARKMEAVGTLAGGVAHDLNNILSGIVSYPELLLMELDEESPLRQPLKTVKKSGEMAATIVQDLLTMARRGVAVTEVVNLNIIVADQLKTPEFINLKERYPDVEVEIDLAADLANTRGSTAHLSKSIMNLIANGAEAMPTGGKLTIATKNVYLSRPVDGYEKILPGEYVSVMVSDGGVGISRNDIERIFEPFYTKKKMGRSGSGLGMAVVWGTMKDHDGFIDVKSTVGTGTTFTLYLPASGESMAALEAPIPVEAYMGNGETILVVDDTDTQREVARSILEKLHYNVACAASGEAAIAHLKHTPVDLIVLDMIMPQGIDGLETFRQIAAINPRQRVIIASGFSETERVKEAQKLGAGQYIKKPYTIEKIGLAIRKALTG